MRVGKYALVAFALVVGLSSASCRRKKDGPGPVEPERPKEIAVTGAASALSRITSDPITEEWPSLSPDGKTLLFHVVKQQPNGAERFGVVGVDPNTGSRRTIYTSDKSSSGFPTWLPDGSSFVYMTDAMGTQSIVRALSSSPNSGVAVAVSGNVAPQPIQPAVSPDGKRVAFRTYMSDQDQIALSGLDGSNLTILGPGNAPQWHPDGEKLVFSRLVGSYQQLFTVEVATGGGLTQLTNDEANNMWPSWSPDGRHIVFTSDRTGNWQLYTIRPDGTVVVGLTEGVRDTTSPHWGHDGFIYFASNAQKGWDIWRLKPIGELELSGSTPAPPDPDTQPPGPPGPGPVTPPTSGGCKKDTDCKGDRICVDNDCVAP